MLKRIQASNWYFALQLGFIGGLIAILVSLVGMVEEFSLRDIVFNVIDMGQTILLMVLVMIGIFALRRSQSTRQLNKLLEAALAGAVVFMLWSRSIDPGAQYALGFPVMPHLDPDPDLATKASLRWY
jgi:hypothetical protein